MLILFSFFSLSVSASELWTRYQFTNIEVPAPSNVNTLYEDSLGQIWVGADSGLYRIYNNEIQKISHGPQSAIEHFLKSGTASIWLATDDGVWHWQAQTNNFTPLTCQSEQSFGQLIEHPRLGLVALAHSGVYQLTENKTCRKLSFDGLPESSRVERLVMYDKRLILAVRGHGLFQCSEECIKVQAFAPDLVDTRVREMVVFNSVLYVGTHKHGFYWLNNQGKVQRHWHKNAVNESENFVLPVNGVMALLPTEQSIWAGLWAGGLQQFDTKSGNKISSSQFYAPDTSSIGGKHVRALLKSSNGTFYVGHENGVSIILPAYNQQGWIGLANNFQAGFSHNNVYSLYYHKSSWIAGTSSGGLYSIGHFDNEIQHLSPSSPSPLDLPTKSVWQITPSQRGDLLLGTSNGVIRLNPNTLDWSVFGHVSQFASADVYSLTEAPDKTLWLSLWEGGIARLDQNGEMIGQWSRNDGLQQNTSVAITSTAENQIFALNQAGLFRYDSEQDKFVSSNLNNPQNSCADIEHINTDPSGQLWALCQHKSLWRLKDSLWENIVLPTTDPILSIFPSSEENGLNNEQLFLLSENSVFALDKNGQLIWQQQRLPIKDTAIIRRASVIGKELVIATNQGLYRQKLDIPVHETPASAPLISGIRVFNKTWEITHTASKALPPISSPDIYQGQLQLNYDQDLITFEFAMPGYHHKPIQNFEYRLLPFDKKWLKTAENEAKASYTRLPPGNYLFEAKALAFEGLPSATFQIEILPPWYLTWWAKALTLFAAAASVLAIIVARTRRLKQSNLWLKERVEERTAELKQANNMLQQAANQDALTGLLNRRGFRNLCDPNWTQWKGKVALMIADIDFFKQVNDQYGHQLGDEVLVTCAQRLKSQAGDHDLIARWGGEEFLILLRDDPITSFESLKLRAQQFQKVIGKTVMELSSENLNVSITAGICDHQGQSFDACLQQADQKLYDGKKSGRNRMVE
ncbi:diguanylate cyclase [uncultured Paraglaciecola sp.]|uniref:diguanylate cyclase domain-containing protein n=1 Tax=uncultured Paraglaciecola sp. TaxID=1765024 RepID=UPI00261D6432|nr:diguanylate cyclase [uncultured Paraglaciecola sp.]